MGKPKVRQILPKYYEKNYSYQYNIEETQLTKIIIKHEFFQKAASGRKKIKMNIFYAHRHLTQMLQVQVGKTMKIKYSEIKTQILNQKSTVTKHPNIININFGVNCGSYIPHYVRQNSTKIGK